MASNTIIPGRHLMNPDVDRTERYRPPRDLEREIDDPKAPSAFPPRRRFDTIYPFTRASEDATNAAFRSACAHDRESARSFVAVMEELGLSEIVVGVGRTRFEAK